MLTILKPILIFVTLYAVFSQSLISVAKFILFIIYQLVCYIKKELCLVFFITEFIKHFHYEKNSVFVGITLIASPQNALQRSVNKAIFSLIRTSTKIFRFVSIRKILN